MYGFYDPQSVSRITGLDGNINGQKNPMERAFDLIVVGTGSAGTSAALAARERGWSVAIVDERPFGGTCVLRGCDPKKVLVAAARVVEDGRRWADLGVIDRAPALNWNRLMRFKHTFTDSVPEQRTTKFESAGIVPFHGRARFEDVRTLRVDEESLRGKRILIASGAKERHVAQGDDCLLTSETFLDLETLPASLLFVGGGYIAFEFAHVAARAGAQVTILHSDAHPLPGFDAEVVEQLIAVTREIGIHVVLGSQVTAITQEPDGVVATATHDGAERSFRAEKGVLAAGRVPDLEDLGLESAGIEWTKKGVRVNAFLQSVSNPNVYAAGDAADGGGLPLTPVAGYEGEIAAANILDGNARTADFRGLASMAYTVPPLATVGLTEAKARERAINIDVRSGDMKDWYSTRHLAGRAAFYKVVLERDTGKVLGATLLGPQAEEQINVLALAIRNGLSGEAIAATLFAYPTGSSDLEYLVG